MTTARTGRQTEAPTDGVVPLYRRVLSDRFDRLDARVACLHMVDRPQVWTGTADVERGEAWPARLAASLFRLPPNGRGQPLTVAFSPCADGGETWDRRFGSRRFWSVQRHHGGGIIAERVGIVTLLLAPDVDGGALSLAVVGARCLGLPLPRVLVPVVSTREFELEGRYCFDVRAALPMVGLLVHYRGSLQPQG